MTRNLFVKTVFNPRKLGKHCNICIFIIYRTTANMGRHKEWRRIAKRERRRRIRTKQAIARDNALSPSVPGYDDWLKEQEALELFEYEQIEQSNYEENEKWLQAETKSLAKWRVFQDRMKRAHQQRLEKEARIKQEWEEEQKKIKEAKERLKQVEEEKKRQQDLFIEKLEQFLSGDTSDPPPELLVTRETKPNMELCPFFNKTACCRFGDQCSRNHRYPGISKTLLAANFFLHFGLENSHFNEYDTDVMLEFEESDTYKVFKEFFYDVVPEFEKFGKVFQFKVCNNHEKHLRGNTYVQFTSLRAAVAAYRALHCRWYGGRQLALQFCRVDSWRNAICGLQSRKRCPKGRACNFLHVFRNPHNLFNPSSEYESPPTHRARTPRSSQRSWRWSESPEVEIPHRRSSKTRTPRSERRRRTEHSSERHGGSSRSSSRRSHRSTREYRD